LKPDFVDPNGRLRRTIVVLLDGQDIAAFDGLDTFVQPQSKDLLLIPVVHGGKSSLLSPQA